MTKNPSVLGTSEKNETAIRHFLIPIPGDSAMRERYKQLVVRGEASDVNSHTENRFQHCGIAGCRKPSSVVTQYIPEMLITQQNERIPLPNFDDDTRILKTIIQDPEARQMVVDHRTAIAYCMAHFLEELARKPHGDE